MDPKMDTGYLAEGETMDDDYDVTRNLLPEELLGIIDQLLCLEVSFPLVIIYAQTDMLQDGMAHGTSTFTDYLYQSLY
jgi:N-alpha-acetyltransferase 35, NatC auxiliary subunit